MVKREQMGKSIAKVSLAFGNLGAKSRCMCIFHQPTKPKELDKLKTYNNGKNIK